MRESLILLKPCVSLYSTSVWVLSFLEALNDSKKKLSNVRLSSRTTRQTIRSLVLKASFAMLMILSIFWKPFMFSILWGCRCRSAFILQSESAFARKNFWDFHDLVISLVFSTTYVTWDFPIFWVDTWDFERIGSPELPDGIGSSRLNRPTASARLARTYTI